MSRRLFMIPDAASLRNAVSGFIVMSDQAPFAPGIEPGMALSAGQAGAVRIIEDYGGGSLVQLRPLLGDLREIIALLEVELIE